MKGSKALLSVAGASVVAAAWGFGLRIDGYDHMRQPLALLGATGMPGWRIANLLVFVLPGLLVAMLAWRLRASLREDSAWPLRMALQLGLLAALGFALQGLFNLDPARLPDDGSNRFHALAWTFWWLAFALSALGLALARGVSHGLRVISFIVAISMPLLVLAAPALWPAALAHRLGIALWLGWWWMLAAALSRGGASSPK